MTIARAKTAEEELVSLRRRVVELEEELAEWKAARRRLDDTDAGAVRLAAIREKLGGASANLGGVRTLVVLMDRAPRFVSHETLIEGLTLHPEECQPNIVSVYIYHARQVLKQAGVQCRIEVAWRTGYRLSVESAAALREFIGEAA